MTRQKKYTKIYTLNHDLELLKAIDNEGGKFTAEEHAFLSEKERGDTVFKSKDDLLSWHVVAHHQKLPSLIYLIDFIKNNELTNILSLGSGECVFEYRLAKSINRESRVVAVDFDKFYIRKAKEFFPEIIAEEFDFFKDDLRALQFRVNVKFDLAVFLSSACVMEDSHIIRHLRVLKDMGVRHVIDFHVPILGFPSWLIKRYTRLSENLVLRRILGKAPLDPEAYLGKFHAYTRTKRELRGLYQESGWKIENELSVPPYKYVCVLE